MEYSIFWYIKFSIGYLSLITTRRELWPFNVSVHIIEPGFFKTGITDIHNITNALHQSWQKLPQHIKEEYGQEYFDKGNCSSIIKEWLTMVKS